MSATCNDRRTFIRSSSTCSSPRSIIPTAARPCGSRNMEMHFFSFGFYHHDICLVKHHKLKMDNGSMLHFSLVARDRAAFDAIRQRAKELGVPTRDGRLIASAKPLPGGRAFCLQDPDRHWIEIIEEPSK